MTNSTVNQSVCARAGCNEKVEAPYVSGGGSRPSGVQRALERLAAQGQYCPACTGDRLAWEREKTARDRVRELAGLGLLPRDMRLRRLALSNQEFEKHNAEAWRRVRAKWPLGVAERSLIFEGPPGVGKTWAASALINSRLDIGERAASIAAADVVALKDARAFGAVDWLHLDDFDKVEWSQVYCLRLFHLLDAVHQRNGHFVVCLNGSLEQVYEAQRRAYRGKWETVRALFDRLAPAVREPMAGPNLRRLASNA